MNSEEATFLAWLATETGYQLPKLIGDGTRWAAVARLNYTHAILTGTVGDQCGYNDRWCYSSALAAHAALAVWDGEDEPAGWHRHPASGRRRAMTDHEIDEQGNAVALGQEYVRR